MNTRDLQAKITRKKIYDTGVKLLSQKDFDDISISEICEKANVSIGTFYYYFNSKRGILFEIYEKGDEFFRNNVEPKLQSNNSLDNIRIFLDSYIEYIKADGVEMVKHLFTPDNELFVKKNRAMQNILKDVIIKGQQDNQIKTDMSPVETVRFIFLIMRGVVFDWCLHDGQYDIADYSQNFIQYICNYIAIDNNV